MAQAPTGRLYGCVIINPLYNYQKVERVTNPDGSRFYTCPETGTPLPSVTTILSATSDRTKLLLWEEAVGKTRAKRVVDEARSLGTLMHSNLENHIQGLPQLTGSHPLRMQARRMADVIIKNGLPKVDEVWGMEVAMYVPELYAGMTDLVGLHDNKPTIMDHKTSKRIKSFDMIEDYCCQASAYILAHNQVHDTNIKRAVIFMVSRELEYKEFVLEGLQIEQFTDQFLRRVEQYYKIAA